MARVAEPPAQVEDHQDDLEILHPERQLEIQGELIEVREYGFIEGMRLRRSMTPFLNALFEMMISGEELTVDDVFIALGDNAEILPGLIAPVCAKSAEWINSLSSADGELLTMAWWGANSSFFMRQLQARQLAETIKLSRDAAAKLRSAGLMSTQPSSHPGTMKEPSEPTQNAN